MYAAIGLFRGALSEGNKFKLKYVIYSKQYFSFLKRDSRIK